MEEIWKDIEGYEGLYQASNLGRVKRLAKTTKFGNSYKTFQENITDGYVDDVGYKYVILSKNGIKTRYRIHKLVAYLFIPNPDNKPEIDHINTIRTDNRVNNLRWVTRKENLNNPLTIVKMKHLPKHKGKEHPRARKILQYDINGGFIKEYDSIVDAANTVNGSKSSICGCCRGKNKTASGYVWKYEGAA